ncbi:MAG: Fe-S protein assembly co-chaperone HscB [Methylococcales bacterium]|nr:Fe-S protein assembly co-chaperone HscB [Methylococcales bacterium]
MQIDLAANYFELFSLPISFDIDLSQLASRYRSLQTESHPDRFANADAQTRKLSVQFAALINEANETLKTPLKRGFYLLKLRGLDDSNDARTTSDTEFLMQQMEYRERLEEIPNAADPLASTDGLREDIVAENTRLFKSFEKEYIADNNNAAQEYLMKLQFYNRLLLQLDDTEARLEDELL